MDSKKIRNFKDLKIWREGVELVEQIYRTTRKFPKEEMYGLVSQLPRSVVSLPSNIAEGFTRRNSKEFKQFLLVALGSSGEAETQLIIAQRLRYTPKGEVVELQAKLEELNRMSMGLIKRL